MSNVASRKKTIVLIVEDEPIIRMLAVDMVTEAGFEALEAENADEAVYILETQLDVRIVFTDIDMPGSMDGLKLAMAVRGRWPPIEIILTSGHHRFAKSELPERSVFIAKPYDPDQIAALLRQFAARGDASDSRQSGLRNLS